MADYGMKASRVNYDVDDSGTTDDELLVTSKNNALKISDTQKNTIASGGTGNVAHGFSYKPFFLTFGKEPAGSVWSPIATFPFANVVANSSSYVNGTNVVTVNGELPAASMDVRTIIFIDQLAA